MELVVEARITWKFALEELAEFFVIERARLVFADEVKLVAVAFKDTAGVGIDHENRTADGVEKDGVGGFGSDAVDGEQLRAKSLRLGARHFCDRTLVFVAKEFDEGF